MKRSELVSGTVYAVGSFAYPNPALVLSTLPWEERNRRSWGARRPEQVRFSVSRPPHARGEGRSVLVLSIDKGTYKPEEIQAAAAWWATVSPRNDGLQVGGQITNADIDALGLPESMYLAVANLTTVRRTWDEQLNHRAAAAAAVRAAQARDAEAERARTAAANRAMFAADQLRALLGDPAGIATDAHRITLTADAARLIIERLSPQSS